MKDTRNWRCFFGMHQWQLKEKREQHYYEYSSSARPYRIKFILRMQCAHCGKFESQIID